MPCGHRSKIWILSEPINSLKRRASNTQNHEVGTDSSHSGTDMIDRNCVDSVKTGFNKAILLQDNSLSGDLKYQMCGRHNDGSKSELSSSLQALT